MFDNKSDNFNNPKFMQSPTFLQIEINKVKDVEIPIEIERKILKFFQKNEYKLYWTSIAKISRVLKFNRHTAKKYILKLYSQGKLRTKKINDKKYVWKLK